MTSTYVTVAIPYVNAAPHLGYAYELVLADVFARARRAAGGAVRFLGGTDDYSLKNVLAAEAAGVPTREFVGRPVRTVPGAGRTARPVLRRLHPHRCGPPSPARGRAAVAGGGVGRRPRPAGLRG